MIDSWSLLPQLPASWRPSLLVCISQMSPIAIPDSLDGLALKIRRACCQCNATKLCSSYWLWASGRSQSREVGLGLRIRGFVGRPVTVSQQAYSQSIIQKKWGRNGCKTREKTIYLRIDSDLGIPCIVLQHPRGCISVKLCKVDELRDGSFLRRCIDCRHLVLASTQAVGLKKPM